MWMYLALASVGGCSPDDERTAPSTPPDSEDTAAPSSSSTRTETPTTTDTGTPWPDGCSDEPFDWLAPNVGLVYVSLNEAAPGVFEEDASYLGVGFYPLPDREVTRTVLDPYEGGEDCERVVYSTSDELVYVDSLDGGPVTWTIDGMTVESEWYSASTYIVRGANYSPVGWLADDDLWLSFGQPDLDGLYEQTIALRWPGTDAVPAADWPDALRVPRALGVSQPVQPVDPPLEDLTFRWDHTGGGRLRFRGEVETEAGLEVLSCVIDDDGSWSMPAEVASALPAEMVWFTLSRGRYCVREQPTGPVHLLSIVQSRFLVR